MELLTSKPPSFLLIMKETIFEPLALGFRLHSTLEDVGSIERFSQNLNDPAYRRITSAYPLVTMAIIIVILRYYHSPSICAEALSRRVF